MKIFCHRPREDWIIDRMTTEYIDHSRHQIFDLIDNIEELESFDIVWLFGGFAWRSIYRDSKYLIKLLKEKTVVCTEHHIVPWKFNQEKYNNFMLRDQFVDIYHTYTKETAKIINDISKKPVKLIPHWFDKKKWFPIDKLECKKELGFKRNDYIIGSFQRDTEGHDFKLPKLEKGPDIIAAIIKHISLIEWNVKVLLGGNRRQYIIKELEKLNIPYEYFENANNEKVNKMYNACDLYIVGSRCEGGPQAIFECAATKTKIISTNVGQSELVLDEDCIVFLSDDKSKILKYPAIPQDKTIENNFKNVEKFKIINQVKEYDSFFESLI